ncbi:MAG: bifunctional riboflavin kinase/FAD synthetase [Naasia sp.]
MTVWRSLAEVPADALPSAIAIGKFDGVHIGHHAVLAELVAIAREQRVRSVVVTFDRNPLALLRPERCPENLVGLEQKIALLAGSDVDDVLVLPFDRALADLPADEFVRTVLVEALRARTVLVGADFRFGAGGRGSADTLARSGSALGFDTVVVGDVVDGSGERASSSAIRELLSVGDVDGAAGLLGRLPSLRGEVVHGLKRGRELGYPTANLAQESDGFVPAEGVYAGYLTDLDRPASPRYAAAISIGRNPTFDDVEVRQVEAHVLDVDLDLYGHTVEVEFAARIRGMVAYEGVEALIRQMAHDVEETRLVTAP